MMDGTAEVKRWWDEFGRIRDLDGKIAAVRRVCALNKEEGFYKGLDIGSAILDCVQDGFIRKRDREGYCRFLESLRRDFPKVFNLDSGYHAGFLIRWYAFTSQVERLADIISHLAEFPREDPDILIDLMDVLIINGFTDEAWKLIQSHYPAIRDGHETVPEGKHEIAALAGIFIIAKHAEDGASWQTAAISLRMSVSPPKAGPGGSVNSSSLLACRLRRQAASNLRFEWSPVLVALALVV